MDFFDTTCQEPVINHALFGIRDDQNGGVAYTDVNDPAEWIATVKNAAQKDLIFTAIDKCVIKDEEEQGRGRCDGMLTSLEHIYFVELKDRRKKWGGGAVEQLESTIQFFLDHHDISIYRHKKAFACNKRGKFQVLDNELNLQFFRKYGFRIDIQAEIIVV